MQSFELLKGSDKMTKQKGRKIKLLKGEKFLYSLIIFLLVLIPVANVYSKAMLSETNIEVEQLRTKIAKQASKNESLGMKINELASLDKIHEVANDNGLSYNNDNIKVIK